MQAADFLAIDTPRHGRPRRWRSSSTVISAPIAADASVSSIAGRAEFAARRSAEVKRRHGAGQTKNGCARLHAICDCVTRSSHTLLRIINDTIERDPSAAIDGLKALIGDIHVSA